MKTSSFYRRLGCDCVEIAISNSESLNDPVPKMNKQKRKRTKESKNTRQKKRKKEKEERMRKHMNEKGKNKI